MRSRSLIFVLVLAIAAVGLIFVFLITRKEAPETVPTATPEGSPVFTPLPSLPLPSPETTLQVLQKYSKLVFPLVTNRKMANVADIPPEVMALIGTDQENFVVEKVTYANKTTGLAVMYTALKSMHETYMAFLEATKTWTQHAAAEAFNAALLERETTGFKMRIEFTTDGGATSEVAIQTVSK